MKVAILTVDYNGHKDTEELLESLAQLKLDRTWEVKKIVVDNGSTESVPALWEKKYGVELLQTGENKGFSGGYNQGMKYAYRWGADFVVIINNDTLVGDRDLLKKLVEAASGKSVGLVSPKILFAPGFEYHKERYGVADEGKVIWYAGGRFDWNNVMVSHNGIDEVDSGLYDTVGETGFVSGCCLLIKREVMEKVGFFPEPNFAYFEDVEFVTACTRAGYSQIYCGNTHIYHKVSRTAGIGSGVTDYLLTRNRLRFGMRHASVRTKFALLREAVRLMIYGRPHQKSGIVDWFLGKGGLPVTYRREAGIAQVVYPVKLSIVVLNYKTLELLKKLLHSIRKFEPKCTYEVVVLDNGSDDGCGKVMRDRYPEVKYIESLENLGFPAGNNAAIEYTKGEYILLLNSDIEVTEGALDRMVEFEDSKNGGSVLGGGLVFPSGEVQDSCFYLPTVWGAFSEYFLLKKGRYFMYKPKAADKPALVEGAVMACFMIPRRVYNLVGPLWDKAFIYFEDIEYCRRLKKHGVAVYYVPDATYVHHHGAASKVAGQTTSNQRLVEASKAYHGPLSYWALYWVMWVGQRIGFVKTPVPRWKDKG